MKSKLDKEPVSPARSAAFDILHRVEAKLAFASVLIARLDESNLSPEDRALAQEIVLGVLRWRRSLDYFIERYARRSIERLDLPVLIALRIGIYQLRFLTRVPQSAAVNESVNLVKRARTRSATGLVNAVLRTAARLIHEGPAEEIADSLERASIELSHPRWILERWVRCLGEDETRALAMANNTPAPLAFRVNTLRTTIDDVLKSLEVEGLKIRESALSPGAFVLESGRASAIVKSAEQGLIYIQDQASQLMSILLQPNGGHRVLDLCAAPGSKATHIASLSGDQAWIVACDIHAHRLATLRATCKRLGINSIDPVAADATRTLPFTDAAPTFDRVLVDAPCSGSGTLRGNPEIKWRLSPDDIFNLAKLQLNLLRNTASTVAIGGRLLYSTCSLEREENEDVVREFLANHDAFRVAQPNARTDLITADGFVRTFPHRHGTDGFFAAVLEKIG